MDVRKLGIDYNNSNCGYTLKFHFCTKPFSKFGKKIYQKTCSNTRKFKLGVCHKTIAKLQEFFKYIYRKYPNWQDLTSLTRSDIEGFIYYLRTSPMGGDSVHKGQAPSGNHIHRSLSVLETFIVYIQRYEWDEAPKKPVGILIVPEDKPRLPPKASNQIKYISDFVWNQIMNHMAKLPTRDSPGCNIVRGIRFQNFRCVYFESSLLDSKRRWLVDCR
jgi:hypothetical protein